MHPSNFTSKFKDYFPAIALTRNATPAYLADARFPQFGAFVKKLESRTELKAALLLRVTGSRLAKIESMLLCMPSAKSSTRDNRTREFLNFAKQSMNVKRGVKN